VLKLLTVCFGLLLVSGCASHGVIKNAPLTESTSEQPYSIVSSTRAGRGSGDVTLTLAFSGGGTRAAALS
jgi:NTE family protein